MEAPPPPPPQKPRATPIALPAFRKLPTIERYGSAVPIGEDVESGEDVLLPLAGRSEGLHVAGGTRQGKTSVLHRLAVADMEAGRRVWVFDPFGGELVRSLLPFVPEWRRDDLVYLPLEHATHVPPLSVFFCRDRDDWRARDETRNRVYTLFNELWGPLSEMPQFAMVLRHVTDAMIDVGGTLLDAWQLLLDDETRRRIITKLRDPWNRAWWENLEATYRPAYPRAFNDQTNSTINKIDEFLSLEHVRHMLAKPTKAIDAQALIAEPKIVLIQLSDRYPQLRRLAGTALFLALWDALRERGATEEARATPVMTYFDEVGVFSCPQLIDLLIAGAKFGSCPTVAYQEFNQLLSESPRLLGAVEQLGNTIAFQLTPEHARRLAPKFDNQHRRKTEPEWEPVRVPSSVYRGDYETLTRKTTRHSSHMSWNTGRPEVTASEQEIPIFEETYPLLEVEQAEAHTRSELTRLDPYFARVRLRVSTAHANRPTYREHYIATLPPLQASPDVHTDMMMQQSLETYCVPRFADDLEERYEQYMESRKTSTTSTQEIPKQGILGLRR